MFCYSLFEDTKVCALADGTGYVEDGREIFDDDEDDTYVATNTKESGRGQKRKKLSAQPSAKGNIRNLLGAMPTKKKEVYFIP